MNHTQSSWPLEPKRFSRIQRSSLLLEASALSRGLDCLRIGTWGFTAGTAPGYTDVGFHQTLSLETSRSAVRASEDRLLRRIALTEAGVRIAPSRRFGNQDVEQAIEYSQRFRHGVLIKPRATAAGCISRTALIAPDEVRQAIESWYEATSSHLTYLVERRIIGREYGFYIVGDQIVSAVRFRNRGWSEEIHRAGPTGFGQVHPDVLSLALEAFKALPAMPHGVIHLKCPGSALDPARSVVVSSSPHIGLLDRRQPQGWSVHMAELIVAHAARNIPKLRNESRAPITAEFTMNEVPDPHSLAEAIRGWFRRHGITGSSTRGDREVTGHLTATVGQLATLSGLARAGKLTAGAPQSVAMRHTEGTP